MIRTWSFYDRHSGRFHGRLFSGPNRALGANTPAGFVAIEGTFDRWRQRVDLGTGAVVTDESLSTPRDRERSRDSRLQQIDELHRKQLRAMAELTANPNDADARKHFDERQAQIAALRSHL